jgi:hypothetical protein
VPSKGGRRARIDDVEEAPVRVTLTEGGVAGRCVVAERRGDGALVLEPERERLGPRDRGRVSYGCGSHQQCFCS